MSKSYWSPKSEKESETSMVTLSCPQTLHVTSDQLLISSIRLQQHLQLAPPAAVVQQVGQTDTWIRDGGTDTEMEEKVGQDLGQGLAGKSAEDQPCPLHHLPTPTTTVQSQLWGSGHTWQGDGAAMGPSEVGSGGCGGLGFLWGVSLP